MQKITLSQVIFYASHLVWVYLAWAFWRWQRARKAKPARRANLSFGVQLCLAGLFIWMRFVEPNWLAERDTDTGLNTGTRVALISDLHLGVFKGPQSVERLAARINELKPDCVLIAGDLLFAPDAPLDILFSGFKAFRVPVYAVLGNHDDHEVNGHRQGGSDSAQVIDSLARAGVPVIENRIVTCGKVAVGGIGDRWSGREDFRAARAYSGAAPLVLLTHNPDTAYVTPPGVTRLLLSGHTHGGQVRLPFVYRHVTPVKGPFDRGLLTPGQWSEDPAGRPAVFTTSGVGMIGLPLRLFNPPVIDLLRL